MLPDKQFNFDDESEAVPTASPSSPQQVPKPLATQPFVVAVLVFLSAAAFVFGGVTILHNVASPFQGGAQASNGEQPFPSLTDVSQATSDQQLKSMDTDGDGISDYDEIHIHRTSPYLKDSDGDTFDDKQEIASGHDPLCASGTNCTGTDFVSTSASESEITSTPPIFVNDSQTSITDPFAQFAKATPLQIRALLIQKGLPQDKVNQLSDADLTTLYQQTLQDVKNQVGTGIPQQQGSAQPSSGASSQSLPPALSALGTNPTPDQIRQVLRSSGKITEEQIIKFDDAALLSLYQQALAKQQSGN